MIAAGAAAAQAAGAAGGAMTGAPPPEDPPTPRPVNRRRVGRRVASRRERARPGPRVTGGAAAAVRELARPARLGHRVAVHHPDGHAVRRGAGPGAGRVGGATGGAGSRHPGRGKYLIKSGERLGLPIALTLTPTEAHLYDTDQAFHLHPADTRTDATRGPDEPRRSRTLRCHRPGRQPPQRRPGRGQG